MRVVVVVVIGGVVVVVGGAVCHSPDMKLTTKLRLYEFTLGWDPD